MPVSDSVAFHRYKVSERNHRRLGLVSTGNSLRLQFLKSLVIDHHQIDGCVFSGGGIKLHEGGPFEKQFKTKALHQFQPVNAVNAPDHKVCVKSRALIPVDNYRVPSRQKKIEALFFCPTRDGG